MHWAMEATGLLTSLGDEPNEKRPADDSAGRFFFTTCH